jgi:hypothetical protein
MPKDDTLMRIVYEHSGEEKQCRCPPGRGLVEFLDHFSVKSLVGPSFFKIIQAGDGEPDGQGFSMPAGIRQSRSLFVALLALLGKADGTPNLASTVSNCPI